MRRSWSWSCLKKSSLHLFCKWGYALSSCCWTRGSPEPPWRPGCRACDGGRTTEPANTRPPAASASYPHWAVACPESREHRQTATHTSQQAPAVPSSKPLSQQRFQQGTLQRQSDSSTELQTCIMISAFHFIFRKCGAFRSIARYLGVCMPLSGSRVVCLQFYFLRGLLCVLWSSGQMCSLNGRIKPNHNGKIYFLWCWVQH